MAANMATLSLILPALPNTTLWCCIRELLLRITTNLGADLTMKP